MYLASYNPTWLEVVSVALVDVLAGHGRVVLCAKWRDQLAQFVHEHDPNSLRVKVGRHLRGRVVEWGRY